MSEPNPMGIFEALNSYQRALSLKTAIELEVFTHVARGVTSAGEIAKKSQASEKGMRILCDYLTIQGFLTKRDGAYGLTQDTAVFLDKQSPAYIGAIATFLAHPDHIMNYLELTSVVRKGGTVRGQGNMDPENPVWVEFAKSMGAVSAAGAAELAGILTKGGETAKVLDISAGPGAYGIEVAKSNPAAQVWGLDWKNVLEVSKENAQKAGVGDRYHTIAGSAFDVDMGSGYDVVLLPNFLHHFDHATNVKLLKKIHAALKPGGRLATVEFVPNEDRISPPQAASFSMMMLGSTESGDAYTFKEFDAMFRDTGFGESKMQPLGPQSLILTAR